MGEVELDEAGLRARVIVLRRVAPTGRGRLSVGQRQGNWVYELFLTNVPAPRLLAADVLDVYLPWLIGSGVLSMPLGALFSGRQQGKLLHRFAFLLSAAEKAIHSSLTRFPFSGTSHLVAHLVG